MLAKHENEEKLQKTLDLIMSDIMDCFQDIPEKHKLTYESLALIMTHPSSAKIKTNVSREEDAKVAMFAKASIYYRKNILGLS